MRRIRSLKSKGTSAKEGAPVGFVKGVSSLRDLVGFRLSGPRACTFTGLYVALEHYTDRLISMIL
jgi:hypothetical protein